MSELPPASFLTTVPLLDGIAEAELEELAGAMRTRDAPAGEILWREGDEAEAMLLIVEGLVSITLRLPGERGVELTSLGPGEVLGELPLLDGGRHSATARVVEPARLMSLSRTEFAALVSRGHPTAFALKRRIAHIACSRLRIQLAELAKTLASEETNGATAEPPQVFTDLEFCGAPDSGYVRRLGTFHAFESLALWGFSRPGATHAAHPARRSLPRGSRRARAT